MCFFDDVQMGFLLERHLQEAAEKRRREGCES